jgi:hypothetical protein
MHAAPATAQNRVENGAFEGGTLTANHGDPHVMSLPAGSATMPNWTVEGAEIAWAENGNPYIKSPSHGRFLDLTGYHDAAPYGGVRQTIDRLTPGLTYELSLELGTDHPRFTGPIAVEVVVESGATTTKQCASNPPANSGVVWEPCSFRFVAQTPQTTIHITGKRGDQYIGLDNVSLTYVSPIPRWVNQFVLPAIIIILALLGLLALVLFVRRPAVRGA